jgi:hypothetical protein
LDGRARNRTVRAKDAAKTWKRPQLPSATFAVVEGYARISWHRF